ncbi:hypothetical protein DPMN_077889 [Dreissena polymorpha]|uniref:Uncharacterized protein n=1 Tax=Dreissena polymorpha TaxID=45954 RepID=A0A9D3YPL8_DREPO|nr:hypothetical protein DPMN_077889 [Dreissena polymorpha]
MFEKTYPDLFFTNIGSRLQVTWPSDKYGRRNKTKPSCLLSEYNTSPIIDHVIVFQTTIAGVNYEGKQHH